jgi:hypothetical protein
MTTQPQGIHHFRTIDTVNEDYFTTFDPVVVVKSNDDGNHVQIKIVPFNANNGNKRNLSFREKMQYFKRTVRKKFGTRGNSVLSRAVADETVVMKNQEITISIETIGTDFSEFSTGFNTPFDLGMTYEEFFGNTYLGLNQQNLNNLKHGLGV